MVQVVQAGRAAGLMTCYHGCMAVDKDAERRRDLSRLENALDLIDAIVASRAPRASDPSFVQALEGAQLKAIDRICPLLARKASLLGLDAPEQKATEANGNGTLAELERKLALVAPGKAS